MGGAGKVNTEAQYQNLSTEPDINITHNSRCNSLVYLPDTVAPRRRLDIVLGIPITVEDDNSVSRGQVYPNPACSSCQQEHERVAVLVVVAIDGRLPTNAHPYTRSFRESTGRSSCDFDVVSRDL